MGNKKESVEKRQGCIGERVEGWRDGRNEEKGDENRVDIGEKLR